MCESFCRGCGEYKEEASFGVNRAYKSGKDSICLECKRKGNKSTYKELTGQSQTCPICKEEKDLVYFYKRKDRSYSHNPVCMSCKKKGLKIVDLIYVDGKKKCSSCGEYKETTEFNKNSSNKLGISCYCKSCERINKKIYRDSLPTDIKRERKRLEYEKNRDKYIKRSKEWFLNNKQRVRETNRKLELNYKYTNPLKYFSRNISSTIRMSFNRKSDIGWKKEKRSEEILGCDMQDFRNYIESQFLNWMSWENMGNVCDKLEYNCSWDLDHIIPVSYATTEEELYKLNHWSNYQPLCSKVNRYEKRGTIPSVCNIELKITT